MSQLDNSTNFTQSLWRRLNLKNNKPPDTQISASRFFFFVKFTLWNSTAEVTGVLLSRHCSSSITSDQIEIESRKRHNCDRTELPKSTDMQLDFHISSRDVKDWPELDLEGQAWFWPLPNKQKKIYLFRVFWWEERDSAFSFRRWPFLAALCAKNKILLLG